MKQKWLLALLVLLAITADTFATPLHVVTVGAPKINCVFNTSCKVVVADTTAPIPIAITGDNFLQSRTFDGSTGAPASGYHAYEYRVDLSRATSSVSPPPCIRTLTVKTGPIASFDFNADGVATDQVYVVTQGGLGSIGIASADQDAASNITFTFTSPVCPASAAAGGQTSYFFGYVSAQTPVNVTATITEAGGAAHPIAARAPNPVVTTACGIPPYSPAYWNDAGTIQYNNNCYNYGNNKRTDTYAQPGRHAGAQTSVMQCPNVTTAAVADGLIQTTATGTCPSGMDKIAMVVAPNVDYHWYRKGSDGMWTHKPGGTPATNLDGAGHTISNPETANRCGPGLPCYSQFCGYFCTCSDVLQGQGHATIQ